VNRTVDSAEAAFQRGGNEACGGVPAFTAAVFRTEVQWTLILWI